MQLHRLCSVGSASLLLLSACYVQQPLHSSTPAPETRVVALLTDTGSVAMANTIGPAATVVEGIVSSSDADAWNLRLMRVDHRGGSSVTWNREVVTFPRFAFSNVSEKRLDQTRSWMAAGLVAVGAFAAAKAFGIATGEEIPTRGPPVQPEVTIIPRGGW